MSNRIAKALLPAVPLLAFVTSAIAYFEGDGVTIVRKAYCNETLGWCISNDYYDCYDDDQDGLCDREKLRPQIP
jgi:hypothetical protein